MEKRAEALQVLNEELARKNQELDAIVKTAPDIIFSRQADGARDYLSDRFYEYTGAPAGSAIGFGWLDYVHADDEEPSLAQWVHCVESGENYECEYRLRGKDGQYRWFRARAVPIRDHERPDHPMVWHLLRHPRQQTGGARHARKRGRTGEEGG